MRENKEYRTYPSKPVEKERRRSAAARKELVDLLSRMFPHRDELANLIINKLLDLAVIESRRLEVDLRAGS